MSTTDVSSADAWSSNCDAMLKRVKSFHFDVKTTNTRIAMMNAEVGTTNGVAELIFWDKYHSQYLRAWELRDKQWPRFRKDNFWKRGKAEHSEVKEMTQLTDLMHNLNLDEPNNMQQLMERMHDVKLDEPGNMQQLSELMHDVKLDQSDVKCRMCLLVKLMYKISQEVSRLPREMKY